MFKSFYSKLLLAGAAAALAAFAATPALAQEVPEHGVFILNSVLFLNNA